LERRMTNVPNDWCVYGGVCPRCGQRYHASGVVECACDEIDWCPDCGGALDLGGDVEGGEPCECEQQRSAGDWAADIATAAGMFAFAALVWIVTV